MNGFVIRCSSGCENPPNAPETNPVGDSRTEESNSVQEVIIPSIQDPPPARPPLPKPSALVPQAAVTKPISDRMTIEQHRALVKNLFHTMGHSEESIPLYYREDFLELLNQTGEDQVSEETAKEQASASDVQSKAAPPRDSQESEVDMVSGTVPQTRKGTIRKERRLSGTMGAPSLSLAAFGFSAAAEPTRSRSRSEERLSPLFAPFQETDRRRVPDGVRYWADRGMTCYGADKDSLNDLPSKKGLFRQTEQGFSVPLCLPPEQRVGFSSVQGAERGKQSPFIFFPVDAFSFCLSQEGDKHEGFTDVWSAPLGMTNSVSSPQHSTQVVFIAFYSMVVKGCELRPTYFGTYNRELLRGPSAIPTIVNTSPSALAALARFPTFSEMPRLPEIEYAEDSQECWGAEPDDGDLLASSSNSSSEDEEDEDDFENFINDNVRSELGSDDEEEEKERAEQERRRRRLAQAGGRLGAVAKGNFIFLGAEGMHSCVAAGLDSIKQLYPVRTSGRRGKPSASPEDDEDAIGHSTNFLPNFALNYMNVLMRNMFYYGFITSEELTEFNRRREETVDVSDIPLPTDFENDNGEEMRLLLRKMLPVTEEDEQNMKNLVENEVIKSKERLLTLLGAREMCVGVKTKLLQNAINKLFIRYKGRLVAKENLDLATLQELEEARTRKSRGSGEASAPTSTTQNDSAEIQETPQKEPVCESTSQDPENVPSNKERIEEMNGAEPEKNITKRPRSEFGFLSYLQYEDSESVSAKQQSESNKI